MRKKLLDTSILSLSLITGIATLLSAAIPFLEEYYPTVSTGAVESLVTVPSLGSVISILLNPFIVKKIGLKKTVLTGILGTAFFGTIPFLVEGFTFIYCSRFLMGLGVGLFSPHAISLIALNYTGQKKAVLLGLQVGMSALGNALFLFLAALLVQNNWHFIYLLHLSLLVIFLLIWRFVPDNKQLRNAHPEQTTALPGAAVAYLVIGLWTFLIIYGVQLKIPAYLAGQAGGGAATGSLTLSLMNLMGLAAGILFGPLLKRLGSSLFTAGYLTAGLAVLLLAFSRTAAVGMVAAVLFNFVYSFTGPYIVLRLNSLTPEKAIIKVNSWFSLMVIGSQFIAPLFWNLIGSTLRFGTSPLLMLIAVLLLLTGILVTRIFNPQQIEN